jgi:AcrR family transcriptional regulator
MKKFDYRSNFDRFLPEMTKANVSRKDRERKAREELIVEHARRLLLSQGFQGFSLDDLAKSIEYSKGTIYLHFESKEDLALAVATAAVKERAALFERAVRFQGNSRERMRAIGFACCHFMVAYPEFFNIELMMKSQSFWEKASEARRQEHSLHVGRTFRATLEVVHAGFESGDLPRGSLSAGQIALGLASVTVGSHIMSQMPEMRIIAGVEDSISVVRQNQDLMLDGLQWRPLLSDYDYRATDLRIRSEIFPEATWFSNS